MSDMDTAFDDALRTTLTGLNVSLDPVQLAVCRAHFERVLETNRTMNLTRITDPTEAAVKHYADSLAVVRWVDERRVEVRTVLDVGTGAGFPAVPLAVARRDWAVTAIDATAKKITFLRKTVVDLGLTNLEAIHAHSIHWKPGRPFDLVVTRALAKLPRALAQSAALVATGGWFIAYKTAVVERLAEPACLSEEDAAREVAAKHGLKLRERYAYDIECGGDTLKRVLHIFQKE